MGPEKKKKRKKKQFPKRIALLCVYIYIVDGGCKPTCNWGAPPCRYGK